MNVDKDIEIMPVGKAKDLTGMIFSRLTVLGRAPSKNRKTYWWCQCSCGNIIKIRSDQLISGIAKSCGCYKKEVNSIQGKILATKYASANGKNNKKDLTGQRFNHLLVLNDTQQRIKIGNGTSVIWKCQCDCGNITNVPSARLISGHTQSCGCIKQSRGEEIIANILQINNIPFQQEYIFKKEKMSTGGYPRFDFFVDNKYVIEYDGEQHFKINHRGWNNMDNFELIQSRDKDKNKICKKYNLPIIRIPYTHLDQIKIEDLLIDSSSFLIKED